MILLKNLSKHLSHNEILNILPLRLKISSVQLLICVRLFVTPWTAVCQASLSITNSQSLLQLMAIESVMPSHHLVLGHPLSPPAFNLSQHQGQNFKRDMGKGRQLKPRGNNGSDQDGVHSGTVSHAVWLETVME